jgi:hypothetical protein
VLNKRFYNGILQHWFNWIQISLLEIRFAQENVLSIIDFKSLSVDCIRGLKIKKEPEDLYEESKNQFKRQSVKDVSKRLKVELYTNAYVKVTSFQLASSLK